MRWPTKVRPRRIDPPSLETRCGRPRVILKQTKMPQFVLYRLVPLLRPLLRVLRRLISQTPRRSRAWPRARNLPQFSASTWRRMAWRILLRHRRRPLQLHKEYLRTCDRVQVLWLLRAQVLPPLPFPLSRLRLLPLDLHPSRTRPMLRLPVQRFPINNIILNIPLTILVIIPDRLRHPTMTPRSSHSHRLHSVFRVHAWPCSTVQTPCPYLTIPISPALGS